MDYCLAYLYWTVQVEPVALIATVSFFTVIILVGISPSGIRLKKKRIKEKVPVRFYWNIFWVEHCISAFTFRILNENQES